MNEALNTRFKKLKIKALQQMPFFGTLLLHAHVAEGTKKNGVDTMATDGHSIFMNEDFSNTLSDDEFAGVLMHEVLHMALKHVERGTNLSNQMVANLAADVIVNGILADNHVSLPPGELQEPSLKDKSLQEIYWILMQSAQKQKKKTNQCLRSDLKEEGKQQRQKDQGDGDGDGDEKDDKDGDEQDGDGQGDGQGQSDGDSNSDNGYEVEWDDVLQKAETINKMSGRGLQGGGLSRIFKDLGEPKIDWKAVLYKYITTFPTDFSTWDRRFLHDDIYIEDFGGTKNEILVFMDTSASVDQQLLSEFLAEIREAVNVAEAISGDVYEFDTSLYHVGDVKDFTKSPVFHGGGGTDFNLPINEANRHLEESKDMSNVLVIIFTDGYAPMPPTPVGYDVLWAVCPNGPDDKTFTFGEVIRIE